MKAHKNSWYKEWHQWRLSHHFHVAMLIFYTLIILLGSLAALFPGSKALASTTYTWDMTTPSEYTYNSEEVQFTEGIAQSAGYSILGLTTKGIYCTDANTCYVAGYVGGTGKIYKTTDGGAHWILKADNLYQVYDIHCPDVSTCYASSMSGRVYMTSDGGENWISFSQIYGFGTYLYGVHCPNANTCYVVGDINFKTIDGGIYWDFMGPSYGVINTSIYCTDANNCYVVSEDNCDEFLCYTNVYKTTNGGTDWSPIGWSGSAGSSTSLLDVYCTDANTCYIVGESGGIYKTTDGGENWSYQDSGTTVWLESISCSASNTCYVASQNGTILKTTNGGTDWSVVSSSSSALYGMHCINTENCYAGGNQYHVKTMNGGTDWIGINYYPMATVIPNISPSYSIITGFKENPGGGSTGTVYYQVSNDDGATWYWYNGTSWAVASNDYYRNIASEINNHIIDFAGNYGNGTGKFKWRAIFYGSSVTDLQKLDSIQIAIRGSAPNKPESLTISDVSNRDKGVWALALSWDLPEPGGTEIDYFKIERSDNGGPWTEVGTTNDGTKRAYAEVVPNSDVTYSYRVRAVDHDEIGGIYDDESESSNIVSMVPTGKYPNPPNLLGNPSVSVTATTANITWSTGRVSSSAVKYGPNISYGLIASDNQTAVTSHNVSLKGLLPGTTYHYKVQSLDPERTYGDVYYATDYAFTTTLAAEISNLKITDIRSDSVLLSWQTTSDMGATVHYGKTAQYGGTVAASSGTNHSIRLSGLESSTTYHLKVSGIDAGSNLVESDDYSFETLAFPKISNVTFEPIKDEPTLTMKVTWDTNVPTSSIVEYSDSAGTKQGVSDYQLLTKHEIIIAGLKDKADYLMTVRGRDGLGNEVFSEGHRIATGLDTRPPGISEITVEKSINGYGTNAKSQMIVSWSTDEPATSQVEYSKGGSGGGLDMVTQEDSSLATSHAVIIPSLEPSSSYYFRIISKDNSRNEAKSEIKSALTGRIRLSVFDIILKSFESSFDWLFGAKRLK